MSSKKQVLIDHIERNERRLYAILAFMEERSLDETLQKNFRSYIERRRNVYHTLLDMVPENTLRQYHASPAISEQLRQPSLHDRLIQRVRKFRTKTGKFRREHMIHPSEYIELKRNNIELTQGIQVFFNAIYTLVDEATQDNSSLSQEWDDERYNGRVGENDSVPVDYLDCQE